KRAFHIVFEVERSNSRPAMNVKEHGCIARSAVINPKVLTVYPKVLTVYGEKLAGTARFGCGD
ncbi:hypothetical protein, partial [Clostridium perfringens]